MHQKMDGPEGLATPSASLLPECQQDLGTGRIRIGLDDVAGVVALRAFTSWDGLRALPRFAGVDRLLGSAQFSSGRIGCRCEDRTRGAASGLCSGQWMAMRICMSSGLGRLVWLCSPRLLRQGIPLRQWIPTHLMLAYPWSASRTRHFPSWSSAPEMLSVGSRKTCMSIIMLSEGYTWVGREPSLELEILAFLIRELVPNISDHEAQRLLELRD